MGDEAMDRIEELLNAPYWIIDVLPMRVPEGSPGQFFAAEKYFLKEQLAAVRQKHINLILKLNCYLDISVDGETNPAPDQMAEMMKERAVCILLGDAMILSELDDFHMTLFHPDRQLLDLVKALSAGEGLFLWKG